MQKIIIKEYKDFIKVVDILKRNKQIEIDLKDLSNKAKVRMLDLITGYIYEKGKIKKESIDKFIICLTK